MTMALVSVCALADSAAAQTWSQVAVPGASPNGRVGHSLTELPGGQSCLLFGGVDTTVLGNNPFGDTWIFNEPNWTIQSFSNAPSPRAFHAAAYDSARERVVLFGGSGLSAGPILSDTWIFDGTWSQVFPATSPPPTTSAKMAYDSARDRIVMFGGRVGSSPVGTTWEFDGNNWAQVSPTTAAPPRTGHAMTYDSQTNRIVMHGGSSGGTPATNTYEYDGFSWTAITSLPTFDRISQASMTFDSVSKNTVMYGGIDGLTGNPYQRVWTRQGATWTAGSAVSSHPGVASTELAFLAGSGSAIAFGGLQRTSSGSVATSVTSKFGPAAPVSAPALSTLDIPGCGSGLIGLSSLPYVGSTFLTDVSGLPVGSSCVMHWGSLNPNPVDLAVIGAPGCFFFVNVLSPIALAPANAQGVTPFALTLPLDPTLVGATFSIQALTAVPGVNPLGVDFSNARQVTIGSL